MAAHRILVLSSAAMALVACVPTVHPVDRGGNGGSGAGGATTAAAAICGHAMTFPAPADLPAIAELPDPFLHVDGTRMTSPSEWECRRQELKAYAQYYEYGSLPPAPASVSGQFDGSTLTVNVQDGGNQASFTAAVTLPAGSGPFPAFIHISSGGPVASASMFTARGYAFIYLDTSSVALDSHTRGGAFYTLYPDADTGVLMAWAWGVHRIVDALANVSQIDVSKLAVNGFSRWGKGALLAGAFDERIALTVPSSSGLSGTGQFRFFYEDPSMPDTANEKIENAWGNSPYWYVARFGQFVNQVTRLPYDQHAMMALVAPRPLIATQGRYDYWTNPRGTSISWRAAETVFDYLGLSGKIGIVWDDVAHELTAKHVTTMLDFADLQFAGTPSADDFHAIPAEFTDEPTAHPWTAP
jgi:endo-1,4-beta-xylanase